MLKPIEGMSAFGERLRGAWRVLTGQCMAQSAADAWRDTEAYGQVIRLSFQLRVHEVAWMKVAHITSQTHRGKENAWAALSRVNAIAHESRGALAFNAKRPGFLRDALSRAEAEVREIDAAAASVPNAQLKTAAAT